jgi:hypothetical protein
MLPGGTAMKAAPYLVEFRVLSPRADRASQWRVGPVPPVPGETEFIPLPEQ